MLYFILYFRVSSIFRGVKLCTSLCSLSWLCSPFDQTKSTNHSILIFQFWSLLSPMLCLWIPKEKKKKLGCREQTMKLKWPCPIWWLLKVRKDILLSTKMDVIVVKYNRSEPCLLNDDYNLWNYNLWNNIYKL